MRRPSGTTDQPQNSGNLQNQTHTDWLDVVHPDITHANPGVVEQGRERNEGRNLEPLLREQTSPSFVTEISRSQERNQQDDGVQSHDDSGKALRQPVTYTIVCAHDEALRSNII